MVKTEEYRVKIDSKQMTIEEAEPFLIELGEQFHETLYELWKSLMTIEMQLFEQCEVYG